MVFFRRELNYQDIWPAVDLLRREMEVLTSNSLTPEQIQKTIDSYNFNSFVYLSLYEFSREMSVRTNNDYLQYFSELTKKNSLFPKALVLGSGNGRDCLKLILNRINVHAVDYSTAMMKKLEWFFTNNGNLQGKPFFESTVSDIIKLPKDFAIEEFDSILIESAFEHVNHPDVPQFLLKALPWLKPGGFIFFRLKITEHGQAYVIHDGVGTRYYTSWTLEEIEELKAYLVRNGYEISTDPADQLPINLHKDDALGTPSFYPIIIRKPLQTQGSRKVS